LTAKRRCPMVGSHFEALAVADRTVDFASALVPEPELERLPAIPV
jgi:hypothetical protein